MIIIIIKITTTINIIYILALCAIRNVKRNLCNGFLFCIKCFRLILDLNCGYS